MSRRTITRMEQATDVAGLRKPALMAWAMATGVPLSWLQTGIVPSGGDGESGYHRRYALDDSSGRIIPFPATGREALRPTG